MNTRQAYDSWASQYDTNANRTRDLEGEALRRVLADVAFDTCLEIGCGTGKNTVWLVKKAQCVTAVDLSEQMLAKARAKINSSQVVPTRVQFKVADITQEWSFRDSHYDLVTFSLVLEHLDDLAPVFQAAAQSLNVGGYVYVGELHPYKQYLGSKARFDTPEGTQVVECFNHHVSDFVRAAETHGLALADLQEHFDDHDRSTTPRILTLLFRQAAAGT